VADRIRTGDRLDHNQELYQLSYSHHAASQSSGPADEGEGLAGPAGFDQGGEGFQTRGRAGDQFRVSGFGL
jgi:hypothetical protein